MTKRVWVHYPPLRHHSELVYSESKGEVYFGGQCPAGVSDMVWTGFSLAKHWTQDNNKHRLLVLEPPVVEPDSHDPDILQHFPLVYTFNTWMTQENVKHYRMGLPPLWPKLVSLNLRPWQDRKDAVVCVTGNKYPERIGQLEQMAQVAANMGLGFDVYGRPGFQGHPWYRGEVQGHAESKRLLLSQYRYCLALENTFDLPLYLTEKLLDGIASGCFCIYLGPRSVHEYPEILWSWVQTPQSFFLEKAYTHEAYLQEVARRFSGLQAINLDLLWRMVLEDT